MFHSLCEDPSARLSICRPYKTALCPASSCAAERAISTIPGAVTKEELLQNGEKLVAGKDLVITHCALGARGGNLAKQIKDTHPDLKVRLGLLG